MAPTRARKAAAKSVRVGLKRQTASHGLARGQEGQRALAAVLGRADDDFRDGARERVLGYLERQVVAVDGHHMRPQLLGQLHVRVQRAGVFLGGLLIVDGLHYQRRERAVVGGGQARRGADDGGVAGGRAHVHEHVVAGVARSAPQAALEVAVQAVGRAAQGQLAQVGEVLLGEEVRERRLGALGAVDLAALQTLHEVVGIKVHQLHRRGVVEDAVGDALLHHHLGGGGHLVVQAFQVLHVHGGENVDARVQQLFHVAVAFGVAAAGGVRVGQLVHEDEAGLAREGRVHVELAQRDALVRDLAYGQLLQAVQQRERVGARMGLDVAHHHVAAVLLRRVGRLEHGVGLAHAGRVAEEYLEAAAPLVIAARAGARVCCDGPQQVVGVGPDRFCRRCLHSGPIIRLRP